MRSFKWRYRGERWDPSTAPYQRPPLPKGTPWGVPGNKPYSLSDSNGYPWFPEDTPNCANSCPGGCPWPTPCSGKWASKAGDERIGPSRLVLPRLPGGCLVAWSLVPAPWSLVPAPWSLVPGPRSLVPGPRSPVPAPRSPVPGPWSLVPGPWSLVPGPWILMTVF